MNLLLCHHKAKPGMTPKYFLLDLSGLFSGPTFSCIKTRPQVSKNPAQISAAVKSTYQPWTKIIFPGLRIFMKFNIIRNLSQAFFVKEEGNSTTSIGQFLPSIFFRKMDSILRYAQCYPAARKINFTKPVKHQHFSSTPIFIRRKLAHKKQMRDPMRASHLRLSAKNSTQLVTGTLE